MKACLSLLYYMLTWLRPLAWLQWIGIALLGASILAALLGYATPAFGLSIYAFVTLLALPYLLAWYPFRVMLGSRRLALLPAFRLQLWAALLLFTLLLALFLPLASMLFLPGSVPPRAALMLFLAATLYCFTLQWIVVSPYSALLFGLGIPVAIFFLIKAAPLLFLVFVRDANLPPLLLAAVLGWGLALRLMLQRPGFAAPHKTPWHPREYVWDGRSDLLGILFGNYLGPVKSAEGTLLLGTPDGFSGRYFMTLNIVCLSPAMGALLVYLLNFDEPENNTSAALASVFLIFSLTTCLIGGFGGGENASRARLIWLRLGGDRKSCWRRLERRIYADAGLLALVVLPITGVALMFFDTTSFDPFTYCLVALVGNVLCNYFGLAARLRQWTVLLQILVAGTATLALVIGSVLEILPRSAVIALMLGLTLLFRQYALQCFGGVDWQLVRPAAPRGSCVASVHS